MMCKDFIKFRDISSQIITIIAVAEMTNKLNRI